MKKVSLLNGSNKKEATTANRGFLFPHREVNVNTNFNTFRFKIPQWDGIKRKLLRVVEVIVSTSACLTMARSGCGNDTTCIGIVVIGFRLIQ
jgi:hypothetical protein